jgi:hypothetical protein
MLMLFLVWIDVLHTTLCQPVVFVIRLHLLGLIQSDVWSPDKVCMRLIGADNWKLLKDFRHALIGLE